MAHPRPGDYDKPSEQAPKPTQQGNPSVPPDAPPATAPVTAPATTPPATTTPQTPSTRLQDVGATTYKQITWTLKVDGDAFKVPDIKSSIPIDVAGSFLATVTIPAPKTKAPPFNIDLKGSLPTVTEGYRIVAVILKLDDATPKDIKALKVTSNDSATPPKQIGDVRELSMDAAKNPLVYFLQIPGFEAPPKLSVVNENPYDVKLTVNLAYGPNGTKS